MLIPNMILFFETNVYARVAGCELHQENKGEQNFLYSDLREKRIMIIDSVSLLTGDPKVPAKMSKLISPSF
jgi:hypothetical protein